MKHVLFSRRRSNGRSPSVVLPGEDHREWTCVVSGDLGGGTLPLELKSSRGTWQLIADEKGDDVEFTEPGVATFRVGRFEVRARLTGATSPNVDCELRE